MWPKLPFAERAPRSLALRLTAVFGLLGYALVGAVGIFLYSSVRYATLQQVDRELETTATVLVHRLDEDRETPDKEWLDLGGHLLLRIADARGRNLVESANMAQRAPREAFPDPAAGWGWTSRPARDVDSMRLRAVAFSQGRIQLARDITDERWMLRRLRNAILLVFLLAPAAAALLGYRLVRLGLAPLGSLVHALDRLRPETLKTRVDPAAVPTELVPLSDALNLALERLESAFGRLSELNGDLAHELRTPLHSLRLEVEDLIGRPGLPEATLDRLGSMMETLEHMAAVIEQMLTLSRLEDPSRQLDMAVLDADGLLASAAAPFESLAEEAGVRVCVEGEPGMVFPGNGVMLRRALHNLLANALRHSVRDGVVHLRARQAGDAVVLEVEDQGEGMSDSLQAQIGRRFLRPDSSRSRRTGGTGLGLAIVQSIAKLHGGSLEVRSREGQGTVIQIILPLT
jgi:two-component system heavy metal sensor histidine kinase CusS